MKSFLFVFFFLSFNLLLYSQNDTLHTQLDEVLVTATKNKASIKHIASSATLITSEEIAKRQSNSLIELLRDIPGVTVSQQGGPGKLGSLFMRGANSNYVLVMVDNMEVNDPSSSNSAYDFSRLQLSDIEKIEIIRGPQSTLYGSEAIAGIVHIFTKSGKGHPEFSIRAEGGTNNFYQGSFTASGELTGLSYFMNFSRLQTEGISVIQGDNFETDPYENNSGLVKIGYNFNERIKTDFSFKVIDSKTDLDHSDISGDDPNYVSKMESYLYNLNITAMPIKNIWESKLRTSIFRNIISAEDNIDEFRPQTWSTSNFRGNRISADWQNNFSFINNNLFTIGLDYKKDEAESEYLSESMFGSFESKFPQKDLRSLGLYVQDFITYGSFSATLGYRYDQNEKFGSISTYRIAPVYFIKKTETKLRATYGTGFKAPSLYNLFAPIYGNQDLKPEKSIGWDIGIDQYLFTSQLSIGITYFKMKFDDMIGFNDNFQSININRAETNGIETMLELKDFHGISITANFTFNETYDLSDPSSDGLQLIRRPKNQFSLFMNYQLENLNLGTSIRYSGKKFDEDFSTFPSKRVSLDPYTLLNFYASYNINESLLIFGRIENITDEDYQDILFYGNLGRSGYLGFEFKF